MIFVQYAVFFILFLLELFALIAFMYWGFQIDKGMLIKVMFGIGTPVIVALIWGTFIAPKASFPVSVPARMLLQLIIFGLAAMALYYSKKSMLAILFFVVVLITMTLIYLMKLE